MAASAEPHPTMALDDDPLRRPRRSPRPVVHYSRFVSLMKVLLPAMAVGILGLVVAWPQITGQEERFALDFADLAPGGVDALTMANPRYFGMDRQNRPFTVTARSATRTDPSEQVVALEAPTADMTLRDGAGVMLDADEGFYRQKDQTVDLLGSVDLYHDQGYEVHTSSARVYLSDGTVKGDEPVRGQGKLGTIEGEGFVTSDRGRTILVLGPAKAVLTVAGRGRGQ